MKQLIGLVLVGLVAVGWGFEGPVFNPAELQDSPAGDMRIGKFEKADGTWQVWLLSAADPAKRRLLYEHDRQVELKFSPDEEWLAIEDHATSDESRVILFKRQKEAIEYKQVADITEEAWKFFDKVNQLAKPGEFHHRYVEVVGWVNGSLIVTLTGRGDGGLHTSDWLCLYQPEERSFSIDLAAFNKANTELKE